MRFKDIDNEQAGLVPDPEPEDDLDPEFDPDLDLDEDDDDKEEGTTLDDSTCDPLA